MKYRLNKDYLRISAAIRSHPPKTVYARVRMQDRIHSMNRKGALTNEEALLLLELMAVSRGKHKRHGKRKKAYSKR